MAGRLSKDKTRFRDDAVDVTGPACAAVAEHVLMSGKPVIVRFKGQPIYSLHVVGDPKLLDLPNREAVKASALAIVVATAYANGALDADNMQAGQERDDAVTQYVETHAVEWEAWAESITSPARAEEVSNESE